MGGTVSTDLTTPEAIVVMLQLLAGRATSNTRKAGKVATVASVMQGR